MSIRWKRSNDGFVESHCGEWSIVPMYWGCVNPQVYNLLRRGEVVSGMCGTQRDAKEDADRLSRKGRS